MTPPVATLALEDSVRNANRKAAAKRTTTVKVPKGARKVTTPLKQKAEALAAAGGKPPKKPTVTKAKRSPGNGSGPIQRLTDQWPSAKKRDVQIGDVVKTAAGLTLKIVGRWTKHAKTGNVPMITGELVGAIPEGVTARISEAKKDKPARANSPAAEVTHTK